MIKDHPERRLVLKDLLIKCGRKLRKFAVLVLALPLILLMRVLRPIVLIRLNKIRSARIGHFAGNMESYLCELEAGMHRSGRVIDIFFREKIVCNEQLLRMWSRVIPIRRGHLFWCGLHWANRCFPGWEAHEPEDRYEDSYGLWDKTKPHLLFTDEEEKRGQDGLRAIGIPQGKPFVGFIARDSSFLAKLYPGSDTSYHDYRDTDIENFSLAMKGVSERGYYGVRMGAVVAKKLQFSYPGIIDYATNGMRNDFMDVYLAAKCEFFLFAESGFGVLPMIFRRPVVCVNLIPMNYIHAWSKDYIVIPRKLWLKAEKRFLRFREIVGTKIGSFLMTEDYERAGIEYVENTAEEIRDAVEEMTARCEGRWETSVEYEDLQRRFWELYRSSPRMRVLRSRVGSKFLLQNKDLLDGSVESRGY